MIEDQPSLHPSHPKTKKTSIQERSVHVGDFVVVNGYRVNRTLLKERFAEGGYHAHETKHFLLFTRSEAPTIILVHWFAPQEITTNITGYLAEEMKPFGFVTSNQRLSELFVGMLAAHYSLAMFDAHGTILVRTHYNACLPSSVPQPL